MHVTGLKMTPGAHRSVTHVGEAVTGLANVSVFTCWLAVEAEHRPHLNGHELEKMYDDL